MDANWKRGEIPEVARTITSALSGRYELDDDELDDLLDSVFQRGYLIGLQASRNCVDSMVREIELPDGMRHIKL